MTIIKPWHAGGQVRLRPHVHNPPSNFSAEQCEGTVDLPYLVPPLHRLIITRMGLEGYPHHEGSMYIFIGQFPDVPIGSEMAAAFRVKRATNTLFAYQSSNQFTGLRYIFPSNTLVNVHLNSPHPFIFGWDIFGDLEYLGD
jgi:hypothetical protein